MKFYYLGLKETTIQYSNFFKNAALVVDPVKKRNFTYKEIFGENIDYNKLENFKKVSKFYDKYISIIKKNDKEAKFMLYNQAGARYIHRKRNLICVNNLKLIKKLNNKPVSRKILKGEVNLLDYKYEKGKNISYALLETMFNSQGKKYVIQQPVGFAGVGTYVVNK